MAMLAALGSGRARGAAATWDGDSNVGVVGDGINWSDPNNWTTDSFTDTPPSDSSPGDDLTFAGGTVGTILLDGPRVANSLSFTSGFSLDPLGSNNFLTNASGNVYVAPSVSAAINANLGGGALTLSGGGTLSISGANIYSGGTNINDGILNVAGTQSLGFGDVNVAGAGTMNVDANVSVNGNVINNGTITVSAGNTLNTTYGNFTQSGGTLNINGTLQLDGRYFYDNGGIINGSVSLLGNNGPATLVFGSTTAVGGTFNFLGGTTTPGQGGTIQSYGSGPFIPSGVTVNFNPSFSTFVSSYILNLPGTVTNAGTLTLAATGQNHNITAYGSTLNNAGTFTINPGPTADGNRSLILSLSNSGTFNVNASTASGSITNTGTISIASGKVLSSTQSFTQSGGTLNINGTLLVDGQYFYDNGGVINGSVSLLGNSSIPTLSLGSTTAVGGTFNFLGGTTTAGQGGNIQSNGTVPSIPSGVTVNFDPSFTTFASSYNLNLPSPFNNAGTLTLGATGQNHGIIVHSSTCSAEILRSFLIAERIYSYGYH